VGAIERPAVERLVGSSVVVNGLRSGVRAVRRRLSPGTAGWVDGGEARLEAAAEDSSLWRGTLALREIAARSRSVRLFTADPPADPTLSLGVARAGGLVTRASDLLSSLRTATEHATTPTAVWTLSASIGERPLRSVCLIGLGALLTETTFALGSGVSNVGLGVRLSLLALAAVGIRGSSTLFDQAGHEQ
jgi:hypothetical protein